MSDPIQDKAPARPKRWVRILLGFSLALNLLVIGAIAGLAIKGPPGRSGPPSMREISAPYVSSFSFDAKRNMRKHMRSKLPERSVAIARNRADYAAFLEVVRAESFDAVKATAILEGQLNRAAQMQLLGRDLAIAQIESMTLDERKAYADRVEEALERRNKRLRSQTR